MNEDDILESWKRQRQSISPSKDMVARIQQIQNRPTPGREVGGPNRDARQSRNRVGLSIAAVLAASLLGVIRISVSLLLGIQ